MEEKAQYKFSFWFSISFILNGYATGIPGVSLGSLCMFIIVVYALIHKRNNSSPISTLPVVYSFILMTLLLLPINGLDFDILNVTIDISKYLLWALFAAVVVPAYFEKESFLYWLKRVAFVLTIYLYIQTIAYYGMSIFLPNIFSIGPLVPYDEGYADYSGIDSIAFLRPASFLSEPSFYGNYALFTLALLLDSIKNNPKIFDIVLSLMLSIGIILSSSTSAIIMLIFIWLILGWNLIKRYKKASLLCLMLIGSFISTIIMNFDSLGDSSSQADAAVFQTFDKFSRVDKNRRLGSSFDYLKRLDSAELLFGVGIGCDKARFAYEYKSGHLYLNSITTLIVQVGYVGVAIFFIFILSVLLKAIRYKSWLVITLLTIYVVKGFASGILFGTYGVMLITIVSGIIYSEENCKYDKKEIYSY